LPSAYVECVVVTGVVPLLGEPAGAGVVTVGGAAVIGVMTMPVTSPLTAFFCCDPIVCRAARVAARFAAAAALASTVSGTRTFGG